MEEVAFTLCFYCYFEQVHFMKFNNLLIVSFCDVKNIVIPLISHLHLHPFFFFL